MSQEQELLHWEAGATSATTRMTKRGAQMSGLCGGKSCTLQMLPGGNCLRTCNAYLSHQVLANTPLLSAGHGVTWIAAFRVSRCEHGVHGVTRTADEFEGVGE